MIAVVLVAVAALLWPGPAAARAVGVLDRAAAGSAGGGVAPSGRAPDGRAPGARGVWGSLASVGVLRALCARVRPGRRGGDPVGVVTLLDALAAGLEAGLTPAAAVRLARPAQSGPMLREVVDTVLLAALDGRPTGPAWERAARRCADPDLAALARAWTLSERLGCPLAEAVTTTARTARTRIELQQRLGSATAGARATCTLLSLLPVGGAGAALTLGIAPATLYGSPFAAASLGLGLCLLLAGRILVRRMIARVDRGAR